MCGLFYGCWISAFALWEYGKVENRKKQVSLKAFVDSLAIKSRVSIGKFFFYVRLLRLSVLPW